MTQDLKRCVIQIRDSEGVVRGTGFVIDPTTAVTCAHVVEAAGAGPGGSVTIVFALTGDTCPAEVLTDAWRASDGDDIAVLRLQVELLAGAKPAILGSSEKTDGHRFRALGYPEVGDIQGVWAEGRILGPITDSRGKRMLQLRTQEVAQGMSGAPVLDTESNRVVGMVTATFYPEAGTFKLRDAAFAVPIETIAQVWPDLSVQTVTELPVYERNDIEHEPRIILCHANEDRLPVRDLYRKLKESGFRPWLDQHDLLPGQKWREEIKRLITDPYNLVVVCLSNNSITKRGVVQQEIKWALDVLDQMPEDTIYLIPARLEDCEVPDRLLELHYVDLFEPDGLDKLKYALDFEITRRQVPRETDVGAYSEGQIIQPTKDLEAGVEVASQPPTAVTQPTREQLYVPVSLRPDNLNWVWDPPGLPGGRVWLRGVPFDIKTDDQDRLTGMMVTPSESNEERIRDVQALIGNVATIYFLLNAAFGLRVNPVDRLEWEGRQIGAIRVTFQDELDYVEPLILGKNIRDWAPINQPYAVFKLTDSSAIQAWKSEDGGSSIDMLQIDLPNRPADLACISVSSRLEAPGHVEPATLSALQAQLVKDQDSGEDLPQIVAREVEKSFPQIHILAITCQIARS